jgi:hypothetical protein
MQLAVHGSQLPATSYWQQQASRPDGRYVDGGWGCEASQQPAATAHGKGSPACPLLLFKAPRPSPSSLTPHISPPYPYHHTSRDQPGPFVKSATHVAAICATMCWRGCSKSLMRAARRSRQPSQEQHILSRRCIKSPNHCHVRQSGRAGACSRVARSRVAA